MHIEKDYKRQVVQIMEKLNSFYKMLKNNAEKYPNKEAIIYDTMTISYSKLLRMYVRKHFTLRDLQETVLHYMVLHHTGGLLICLV